MAESSDSPTTLLDLVAQYPWNQQEGFDWAATSQRLTSLVVTATRKRVNHYYYHYHHFDPSAVTRGTRHPYYYSGNGQPPSLEELMAWMWTPETMTAFGLLLLAMTIIACCWFSHKIGEWICTAAAGFLVTMVLVAVVLIFASQWF